MLDKLHGDWQAMNFSLYEKGLTESQFNSIEDNVNNIILVEPDLFDYAIEKYWYTYSNRMGFIRDIFIKDGRVMELVDNDDLESSAARRVGSSPTSATKFQL